MKQGRSTREYVPKELPKRRTKRTFKEQMVVLKPKLDDLTSLRQEIGSLHAKTDIMIEMFTEISVLLKGRVDVLNEMDKKELEVMDALLKKMGK